MILPVNTYPSTQRRELLERTSDNMQAHIMYRRDMHDDLINVLRALIAENAAQANEIEILSARLLAIQEEFVSHQHAPPLSAMVFS